MRGMITLGLTAVVCLLVAAPAAGQLGTLCLFSDTDGQSCVFDDTTPAEISFHVIHANATSVTGVQFSAPLPACMTGATYLGDDWAFPVTIGSSQTDIAIGYGACRASPLHILTIHAFGQGSTVADCAYPVLPADGFADIEAADCSHDIHAIAGGTAYINSSLACDCPGDMPVGPALEVTPASLFFAYNEVHHTLDVTNAGMGTLDWQVFRDQPWLLVAPTSGTGDGTIDVNVNRGLLPQGSYEATVTVISNGGSAQIPVIMSVQDTTPPVLSVSPTLLPLASNVIASSFRIENAGGGILQWNITESIPWATVSPTSGSGSRTITVTVDRTGLSDGTHTGTIVVNSNGGNETVTVSMSVVTPVLHLSRVQLEFGTTRTQHSFNISNASGGILEWTIAESIPWLSLSPMSGTGDDFILVIVDRTGLQPGAYSGTIFVTSNGGNGSVHVTMTVPDPVPLLGFSPSSLAFSWDVDSLGLSIYNNGQGTIEWAIAADQPWLSAVPSAHVGDATAAILVDRTGLSDGTYNANLTITSNGGTGHVPVTMAVATTPVLGVNRSTLNFGFSKVQSFGIFNTGAGTIEWTVSADQPWILIDPPLSGSGDATVTVRVDVDQLPGGGQQTGHIHVTSNGGSAVVNVVYTPPPASVPGYIGLFADPQGTDCALIDVAPGLLQVYVVHQGTPGATASQFSAPLPDCWAQSGAIYLADTGLYAVTIGNSQTGVALGYGTCLASPIHILSINYFVQGFGAACCEYPVLPDPKVPSGQIEVVDCANNLLYAWGGISAYVNPDGSCHCGGLVPVHDTTWGHIKQMYAPEKPERGGDR